MAGVAVVAYGTTVAQAADEDNSTSEPEPSKWSIIIGGGGAYLPDYEGSDDYEFQPFPFASIVYDDFVFISGPSLGVNLLNHEGLKAGPIARYSFGRDEDDNNALEGLGDVDDSIELGGFIKYEIGIWSAGLTVTQDVAGGHEGLLAEATTGVAFALTENLRSSLEASASWADSNYMETYFGISSSQAASSGYGEYEADSGFKDAGVTFGLDYRITESIGIGGRAQYKRLLGDAADSPIVADEGSADQFLSTLFLTYRFR
ncbi:MipA/OmpV family protein [Taklimakanibacter lacteus]|uniref:MipA/OmpV family protein n=1 Tax=Taklimakanibacter lacteus TaxID=2268456 RepID=UPI0013C3F310